MDESKLNKYFLKFTKSPNQNAVANDPSLANADIIEILITLEKPEKRDIFFSIPPEVNIADITFSRINRTKKINLIVYVKKEFLEKRSLPEAKKILELQSLEIMYILANPEIIRSPTLLEDMVAQISKYQSEIGPLFK